MKLSIMSQVKDVVLRSTLISSAKFLEKTWKDGTLQIGQVIKNETPYGLRVDVTIQEVKADKPLIYTYIYTLNGLAFQEWLDSVAYLCEGALAFSAKGVQVMVYGGVKKYDKSAFTIEDQDGDKISLNLLNEEVKFVVHRDVFSGQEWEVLIEDSEAEPTQLLQTHPTPEEEDVPW